MNNKVEFCELYTLLSSEVEKVKEQTGDLLSKEIRDVPTYDEVQITEFRYKGYADVTNKAWAITKVISESYLIKNVCVNAKQKLAKDTITPARLLNQQSKDIDFLIQDIDNIISSAVSYKEGIDALLRFYQNSCYMFGSILEVKSSI